MGIFCSFSSLHPLGKEEDGNDKHQNELLKLLKKEHCNTYTGIGKTELIGKFYTVIVGK